MLDSRNPLGKGTSLEMFLIFVINYLDGNITLLSLPCSLLCVHPPFFFLQDTTLENETFIPFETFIKANKIKDVHFIRNLHNFVYDVTDA